MKYKLVLFNSGASTDVDQAANFSFYRKSDAVACGIAWCEFYGNNTARLWDGQTWTFTNP